MMPLSEYDRLFAVTQDVRDGIAHADNAVRTLDDPHELVSMAVLWDDVVRDCSTTRDEIHTRAGGAMTDRRIVVDGKSWQRNRVRSRRGWNNDGLLRAVLDSRLVNKLTGEVSFESAYDRVRAVYPLSGGSARVTQLQARGIDPDDFCQMEERGWRIGVPR